MRTHWASWAAVSILFPLALAAPRAMGNIGPFVVKYPGGDVAEEGVLARLDPSLKPARETRLRVVKEDLQIGLSSFRFETGMPPDVGVLADYTIENPSDQRIEVDFGFPILRGTYLGPNEKDLRNTSVWLEQGDKKDSIEPKLISDSMIYATIRRDARELIDRGIAADAELARRVSAVRAAAPSRDAGEADERASAARNAARESLRVYLAGRPGWQPRDSALLVEYASLDLGESRVKPNDRQLDGGADAEASRKLAQSNLGALAAIGEQKATQFFAQLAECFDKTAAAKYEAIFTAWGGDVRERSLDLATGQVRPREYTLTQADAKAARYPPAVRSDPTVYARIDYLDPKAKLTSAEKASCRAVLKNLPVTFTFAPMNLLRYQVGFPAKSTTSIKVSYIQYMFTDDRAPASYQIAYVLHPASLWDDFGPIHLTVAVPKGVRCKASVPTQESETDPKWKLDHSTFYHGTLTTAKEKTGQLFIGVDRAAWDKHASEEEARFKREAAAAEARLKEELRKKQEPAEEQK
jgi:hypothetical protein